jgi:N utilization substance protein A
MPDRAQSIDFANGSMRDRGQDDVASEDLLDRLEQITGGSEEPVLFQGDIGRQKARQDAATEEELDALQVNLVQDDDSRRNTQYGTGVIVDDVAQERIAGATEVGKELEDRGVNAVVPGREDTSARLRRRHPDTGMAPTGSVVEGNVEETPDEGGGGI